MNLDGHIISKKTQRTPSANFIRTVLKTNSSFHLFCAIGWTPVAAKHASTFLQNLYATPREPIYNKLTSRRNRVFPWLKTVQQFFSCLAELSVEPSAFVGKCPFYFMEALVCQEAQPHL